MGLLYQSLDLGEYRSLDGGILNFLYHGENELWKNILFRLYLAQKHVQSLSIISPILVFVSRRDPCFSSPAWDRELIQGIGLGLFWNGPRGMINSKCLIKINKVFRINQMGWQRPITQSSAGTSCRLSGATSTVEEVLVATVKWTVALHICCRSVPPPRMWCQGLLINYITFQGFPLPLLKYGVAFGRTPCPSWWHYF